ncbi:MAG: hypothetical protein IK070_01355 [Clostridia bacterium]|nr:hypothetical protein [Clostridia bacterium]
MSNLFLAPYDTNIGFPWWAILITALAIIGTCALTTFLILERKNKKDSD